MMDNDNNEYGPAPQNNGQSAQFQQPGSYCKYCGTFIQTASAYCPACGKPQGNVPQQRVEHPVMNQPQQYPQQYPQQPVYSQQGNVYGVNQQPPFQAGQSSSNMQHTQTIVNVQGSRSNGLGTAGFVLALLSFIFCWAIVANVVLWFLGFLFSLIGVFKKPRGLAIAGLVISLIDIIIVIVFFGALIGLANH